MVAFQEAETAGFAGLVVTRQAPLRDGPGDVEAGALPLQLVHVLAQGGPLLLLLLLHITYVTIMPLFEGSPCHASVGLGGVAVGLVHLGSCATRLMFLSLEQKNKS